MKVEFSFNDRTAIILKPENEREKSLIRLAIVDNPNIPTGESNLKPLLDSNMVLTLQICALHE